MEGGLALLRKPIGPFGWHPGMSADLALWVKPQDWETAINIQGTFGNYWTQLVYDQGPDRHLLLSGPDNPFHNYSQINGLPLLYATTTQTYLYQYGITKTLPFTVMFVARFDDLTGSPTMFDGLVDGSRQNFFEDSGQWAVGDTNSYDYFGTSDTNAHLFTIRFAASSGGYLRVDGAQVGSNFTATENLDGLILLNDKSAGFGVIGGIGEFLLGDFSPIEEADNEEYLARVWGF
jgi:hypothetical protein